VRRYCCPQLTERRNRIRARSVHLSQAAVQQPQHKFADAERPDLATLAAATHFGLARNHGYVDGKKRTAFMAAYVFLGLNGFDLEAEEPEVVSTMERVAGGRVTEKRLADWIRTHLRTVP